MRPAVVVESSPDNFQVWLNHGRIISEHFVGSRAAKEPACLFGGDPATADWGLLREASRFHEPEARQAIGHRTAAFRTTVRKRETVYSSAADFLSQIRPLIAERLTCPAILWACDAAHAGRQVRSRQTMASAGSSYAGIASRRSPDRSYQSLSCSLGRAEARRASRHQRLAAPTDSSRRPEIPKIFRTHHQSASG